MATTPATGSKAASQQKRGRSCTDSDLMNPSTPTTHFLSNRGDMHNQNEEVGSNPGKARLFKLFEMIEHEFDSLYAENITLRARIASLTGCEPIAPIIVPEMISSVSETKVTSARKGMQMGQKLRTALRGPQARLTFKVGADGSRFRLIRQFDGHRDGVWHVATDSNGGYCASASADQTSRVWSLETGQCVATYGGHSGSVNCVAFAPDTNELTLVTASGDESAHIWKVSSGNQPTVASSEDENEQDNQDENVPIPTTTDETKIKTPIMRLTGHTGPVQACDWLEGGKHIITASWDRSANIYDVEKGEILNILSGHELELNHCSAHPSQRLVVTSSKDSTFRLWDFRESIQSVAVFQGHQDSVTSVSFSAGDRIVSGSDDRTVKVWDLRNMRSAISTIRLSSSVNRVSVSKTHNVIAIPLDNRHVRIYDFNGNRLQRIPNRRCHTRMVSCCAWADDHSQNNLITAGFDRIVCGWKVALTKE